mmetsp:Transcript_6456/g.17623  ORF Transcript_6456/g.17623 Transcript_6456/m.17623 type:complete len:225 (-) Transcript_6456:2-676(-)
MREWRLSARSSGWRRPCTSPGPSRRRWSCRGGLWSSCGAATHFPRCSSTAPPSWPAGSRRAAVTGRPWRPCRPQSGPWRKTLVRRRRAQWTSSATPRCCTSSLASMPWHCSASTRCTTSRDGSMARARPASRGRSRPSAPCTWCSGTWRRPSSACCRLFASSRRTTRQTVRSSATFMPSWRVLQLCHPVRHLLHMQLDPIVETAEVCIQTQLAHLSAKTRVSIK